MKKLTVLVTGANGNLGSKLVAYLGSAPWCAGVVAVCHGGRPVPLNGETKHLNVREIDLSGDCEQTLGEAMSGVDAVVHLAAQNPYPTATWRDAEVSFDMALKVWEAAESAGVARVVFASSNHVMGGYKEHLDKLDPGTLTTFLPPLPGTATKSQDGVVSHSSAYAAAKLMTERAYIHFARSSPSAPTAVCIRIGWCQAGTNRYETITATGLEGVVDDLSDPEVYKAQRWFRGMWLSNRDFHRLIERSIVSPSDGWPQPGIVVNGMSANQGMVWDITQTRSCLDYTPVDGGAL